MSRKRSDSAARLEYYYHLVKTAILSYQHPVTGLLPATTDNQSDAWVRDNVYSVMAVWALAMAYRKRAETEEGRARAYQLERSVVKLMRGLLFCMMRQADKVEAFKQMPIKENALHAKYDITTGATCVGDDQWGHLQVDATALYILMLAQMTTSGLQIIFSLDEVSFIQNLVFYIESAYRTPDFGIWERGDKTNQGQPELNASSVGMAKAALEAINEFDLFGCRGGPESVIHVLADERQHCRTILHSLLPRESSSKEIDSALLSVIGFPAFACNDPDLVEKTREKIETELKGRYGCKRFKRDGYRTVMEDPRRPYYERSELKNFDNIECEWPVFFCYLLLDGFFHNNRSQVTEYRELLNSLVITQEEIGVCIPELYYVPRDKADLEKATPHSQERQPGGKIPHLWGQSLYILGCLLEEGLIVTGEIDPLNRHYYVQPKVELVVQVALVAEDDAMKQELSEYDIPSQTAVELQTDEEQIPIHVLLARQLGKAYTNLGKNEKLGLSGRTFLDMGTLSTCKLYRYKSTIYAFYPQVLDHEHFYSALDNLMTIEFVQTSLAYLKANWEMNGRPTITLPVTRFLLGEQGQKSPVMNMLQKLRSGYSAGVRTQVGKLADFLKTSHITKLSFMHGYRVVENILSSPQMVRKVSFEASGSLLPGDQESMPSPRLGKRTSSLQGQGQIRPRSKSLASGSVRRSRRAASGYLEDMFGAKSSPKSVMDWLAQGGQGSRKRSLWLKEIASPAPFSPRNASTGTYGGVELTDLLDQLASTNSLQDQADILHFLYLQKGLKFDCKLNGEEGCTVEVLLEEVYVKAAHQQMWSLVRHTAGMVGKQVEELAAAATDILVHQKQFTIGLPPATVEVTRPLPPEELNSLIYGAYGEDVSTAVLTQEILMYLAMFIRTTPKMFLEMLTLRIGLIIHVMIAEIGRVLKCSNEEATEQLMNLRPSQVKLLLYHIVNGEDFTEETGTFKQEGDTVRRHLVAIHPLKRRDTTGIRELKVKAQHGRTKRLESEPGSEDDSFATSMRGQWLRRRRLDGALNRVPIGFYRNVWRILQRCRGLQLERHVLYSHPTIEEMTEGELKFALHVESWLNQLPQPEYRQLMVEALMVVGMLVDADSGQSLGDVLSIDSLVYDANRLFLESVVAGMNDPTFTVPDGGRISEEFYDSAPSGRYGTMSYLTQAVVNRVQFFPRLERTSDCRVS